MSRLRQLVEVWASLVAGDMVVHNQSSTDGTKVDVRGNARGMRDLGAEIQRYMPASCEGEHAAAPSHAVFAREIRLNRVSS
jgi:hypothetical protein